MTYFTPGLFHLDPTLQDFCPDPQTRAPQVTITSSPSPTGPQHPRLRSHRRASSPGSEPRSQCRELGPPRPASHRRPRPPGQLQAQSLVPGALHLRAPGLGLFLVLPLRVSSAPTPTTEGRRQPDCIPTARPPAAAHRRVLEVVKAVVSQDEPASLPSLHPATCTAKRGA